jgi:uncharacterized protein
LVIGVLHIELILHQSQSLKDKRSVIRKIQGRIRSTFEVSVAEVGSQDLWQHGELGIVTIGVDRSVINQVLDRVLNFVDSMGLAEVVNNHLEFINL